MKPFLILAGAVILMPGCRIAQIGMYNLPDPPRENCYYEIQLAGSSFLEVEPIVSTDSEQVWTGDQWETVDGEGVVVGYSVRHGGQRSFLYFLEEGLNGTGSTRPCGTVRVTRLHYYHKRDLSPGFSAITLFIPNIFGLPLRSNRVDHSYLFEVFDLGGDMIYRDVHSGTGKAKLGFYYGWKNTPEKAEYDAAYAAVQGFLEDFSRRE